MFASAQYNHWEDDDYNRYLRRTSRFPCPGPVVSPGAVPCSMSHAALLSRRHPLQIPPPQFRGSCQCVGSSLVSYKVLLPERPLANFSLNFAKLWPTPSVFLPTRTSAARRPKPASRGRLNSRRPRADRSPRPTQNRLRRGRPQRTRPCLHPLPERLPAPCTPRLLEGGQRNEGARGHSDA